MATYVTLLKFTDRAVKDIKDTGKRAAELKNHAKKHGIEIKQQLWCMGAYDGLAPGRRRFRLLGVAGSGLAQAGAEQVALIHGGRWGDAERALDRIERRFGAGAAVPAALLRSGRRADGAGGRRPSDGRSGEDPPGGSP